MTTSPTPRKPLTWTEVRVLVPAGWQELVAEVITLGPCTSAAFGRPNLGVDEAPEGFDWVRTFLPSHADDEAARAQLRAAIAGLAEATGCDELAGLEPTFKPLPPEDYATSWKKSWKPFRVGPLCLLPPWDAREVRAGERRFTIEPGGSFGSGRHATTRTCLRVLTRRIRGGERVLDAGSGSGILSVAAALLGARAALGFDVDPNSEVAGALLAQDNDVTARCTFRTGGFESLAPDERDYDVVLANIYSDVIQEHAADLRERLSPTGWFAFSGCPAHHEAATLAAIEAAGLALDEHLVRGRWHTFVGRRAR
ncbi:MAG: 50S ribosomal protein L11 methyltransferase [Planctomycetes bacterium]|nr:50S ribosomal protein L11 methyltransferase [Planctomycetota bacterium]